MANINLIGIKGSYVCALLLPQETVFQLRKIIFNKSSQHYIVDVHVLLNGIFILDKSN